MRRRIRSLIVFGTGAFLFVSAVSSQEPPRVTDSAPAKAADCAPATTGSCCDAAVRRICVEVPPPEIIIQRAGGACAPEPRHGFFQRCGHFRMHQWTHISGHGHGGAGVSGIPTMFAPQAMSFAPQATTFAPQAFTFAPQAATFAPQAFTFAPQAATFAPQALTFSPQALTFAPQAASFAPQAFTFTPQAAGTFTPQASPSDGMDIKDAVKKLAENMEAASKLLKSQAQILKVHDDRISDIESTLRDSKSLLDAVKGKTITIENGFLKAK